MLKSYALAAAACLLTLASADTSRAGSCNDVVSATGRAANPMNYDPPMHYDMEKMARARATAAWQAQVSAACPKASASWSKAANTSLECEGYAGGLECTATGKPAG